MSSPGADPGFQVGGGALKKKLRRAEYFVWKTTILRQQIIFFPILGGGHAPGASPLRSAPVVFRASWVLDFPPHYHNKPNSEGLHPTANALRQISIPRGYLRLQFKSTNLFSLFV